MEWGSEIAVDGRPEWLVDEDIILPKWAGSGWSGMTDTGARVDCCSHTSWDAIKLPADHWAYPVIAKGFTPWGGGDEAPGDADLMGGALMRSGMEMYDNVEACRWDHQNMSGDIIGYRRKSEQAEEMAQGEAEPCPDDRPATPRPFAAGDWVVLKETGEVRHLDDLTVFHINDGPNRYRHATPEEITVAGVATARFDTVAELMDDLNDTIRLTKITRSDAEARMLDIPTLTELGLLADPTDIERFEDFHGGLSDSERGIAEAALLWARENG